MRTEDDLRAALAELERHAPDARAVLAAVRAKTDARQVIVRRRLTWSVAATAATAVAAVFVAAVVSAGAFGRATHNGPPASASSAAAVLRQLAAKAAVQPTPALGPVLYAKNAIWAPDPEAGMRRNGMPVVDELNTQEEWVSASTRFLVVTYPPGKRVHTVGQPFRSWPYGENVSLDPMNNQDWNWRNPATLPANPAALRRHLLGEPGAKAPSGEPKTNPRPLTPDETVFSNALQFMVSEPLRPAVRAAMLLLIADIVRRSSDKFVVLGTVKDRAGHGDIAIAGESNEIWAFAPLSTSLHPVHAHTSDTQLVISFFDPGTGWLRAREYATCSSPVSTFKQANARCTLASYEQNIVTEAVRSLPPDAIPSRTAPLAPYVFPWEPVIP